MNLDRQLIWLTAAAVGYIALLFPLFRRGKKQVFAIYLALFVVTSLLWAVARGIADWEVVNELWRAYARQVMVYGLVVLSALLGALTMIFLRQEARWAWIWPVIGGMLVLIMGALDWFAIEWPWWATVSDLNLPTSISIAAWTGLCGTAYFLSWLAFSNTRRPLHRNRLRYWLLILVLILGGDALFISFGFPYDELGTLLHWSGTALAIVALLSHHLPDLSGVARHIVRYLLLTLFTALIFFGSLFGVQYATQYIMTPQMLLILMGAVALALAILDPLLRHWIQQLLNKLLFGEGYDRDRILREYSQGISNIVDLNILVTVSIGIISEAMEIERGALLVCDEMPEFRLRPVPGMGAWNVEPIVLDRTSPPIARMLETGMPVLQYDLDLLPQFKSLSPEERAWFSNLDVEVYVPIRIPERLLGIFVLGAKKSGESYSSRDIALLRTLAGQTAIALQNARLVEDLKRLNTEITQLNKDLTETNERLAIIDRTKSDFISIASHELKTPLTHIRGYTDMLLELVESGTLTPAAVRSTTQGISKGAMRLQSVIDAMLDVSLIETEAFLIHPIPISLSRTIERVIDGLEEAFYERKQSVISSGLENLPDVIGDDTRLHQAFRNVIQNSIKYTPDGGKIYVDAQVDQDQIHITIRDTGIGIDLEHQELIFDKFYRVGDLNLHSTGQTKFKGAGPGLGLPIARGIIEAHGGRIWVESEGYDETRMPGSIFHILLPINGPQMRTKVTI